MEEIEYYDAELRMSSWLVNGEWYWDLPSPHMTVTQIDAVSHYMNGELHREDGPAIEYSNGILEWWHGGNFIEKAHIGQIVFKR